MTDEISVSFHVSMTIWMTAVLLSSIINILGMSLSIFNNYGNTYVNAVTSTTDSTIKDLVSVEPKAGAVVYSSLVNSLGNIDLVYICQEGYTRPTEGELIYHWKGEDNLMKLMTLNKNKKYQVVVTYGYNWASLNTIVLVEVK